MAVGALWYGPLFGKAWMEEAGMTIEKIEDANMAKIYGVATVFWYPFCWRYTSHCSSSNGSVWDSCQFGCRYSRQ
jgi:hypothetical protein